MKKITIAMALIGLMACKKQTTTPTPPVEPNKNYYTNLIITTTKMTIGYKVKVGTSQRFFYSDGTQPTCSNYSGFPFFFIKREPKVIEVTKYYSDKDSAFVSFNFTPVNECEIFTIE